MATQGYANYLKQCFGDDVSVASCLRLPQQQQNFLLKLRQMFLLQMALKCICLKALRPTPELSFAIRTLQM